MSIPTSPAPRPNDEEALARALHALVEGSRRTETLVPLSDLSKDRAAAFAAAWPGLPEEDRAAAVRRIGELSEDRLDLNFGRALRTVLDDPSPVVRQLAVAALWEDEGTDLLHRLLDLARHDASEDVRAEAAQGLGRFADRAVGDRLDETDREAIRTTLERLTGGESNPYGVRRRALESLSRLGSTSALARLIDDAYESGDQGLQASALFAMGRSLDSRWLDTVLRELESDEAELRFEAARAAGHLADDRAVPGLAPLVVDQDAEVRYAAIASLGQVGGRAAVRVLRNLADEADERDLEAVEEALDEALATVDPLQVRA